MINKKQLVQEALMKALQIRQRAKIPLTDALCVYDFVEANGINEVRFTEIPSLEELYWKEADAIFVSSLRPPGRQAFNCAHGFGHYVFGHGTCITGVPSNGYQPASFEPDEFLVDCFAGFLMMPRTTVSYGFAIRGWQLATCTPLQVYTVACWLGVGYATLIHHMRDVLKLISRSHAESLAKTKPKQIRAGLMGDQTDQHVIVLDTHWTGRPVDIEIDDFVMLPPGSILSGDCITVVHEDASSTIVRGVAPGDSGRISLLETQWCAFLRVARRGYCGRNLFRHLEDPDHVNG